MATQYTAGFSAGDVLTAANMNSIGAASETYTPAVQQVGAVTANVTYAQYFRINKLVIGSIYLAITGTGTAGTGVNVTLPIAAKTQGQQIVGGGIIFDSSATNLYLVTAFVSPTSSKIEFFIDQTGTGAQWGVVPNVALGNNDQIRTTFMYEIA